MNSKLRIQLAAVIFALAMGSSALAQDIQSISTCAVIAKPGSYMLAKNITARVLDLKSHGPSCILILADFVTLDLHGFTVKGPGSGFGIYSSSISGRAPYATLVRNGAVTNFDRGIALEGNAHSVKAVRVEGNAGVGVSFDGTGITVEEVHALLNGTGILCFGGVGHSVRNSEASANGGSGIDLNWCSGSSVIGNTVSGNGGAGIAATCPSVVLQNMAFQNGGGDIVADPAACTRSDNSPAP